VACATSPQLGRTSTIAKREKIRRAFTFDHHFAKAGFRIVG